MSKTYVQPTLVEFTEVLQGFRQLSIEGTRELVFGKRVDRDGQELSLRVYTSLEADGLGRDCGEDAIRVAVYVRLGGDVRRVGNSKRVNRVAGWQQRLLERIKAWEELLGPPCPVCGAPTAERKGAYGAFFGCCHYPRCKGTVRVMTAPGGNKHEWVKKQPKDELDFHEGSY